MKLELVDFVIRDLKVANMKIVLDTSFILDFIKTLEDTQIDSLLECFYPEDTNMLEDIVWNKMHDGLEKFLYELK